MVAKVADDGAPRGAQRDNNNDDGRALRADVARAEREDALRPRPGAHRVDAEPAGAGRGVPRHPVRHAAGGHQPLQPDAQPAVVARHPHGRPPRARVSPALPRRPVERDRVPALHVALATRAPPARAPAAGRQPERGLSLSQHLRALPR